LATDVVDALTTYSCGAASQVQIIKDAGHALELGVCLGSICPAGNLGGPTRVAVEDAIETAYLWLLQDPPTPDPVPSIVPVPAVVIEDSPKSGTGAASWLGVLGLLLVYWRRVWVSRRSIVI
jgi:hypothetical protein